MKGGDPNEELLALKRIEILLKRIIALMVLGAPESDNMENILETTIDTSEAR